MSKIVANSGIIMGGFASIALGGNFMAGVLLAGSLALIGISIVVFHDELKERSQK